MCKIMALLHGTSNALNLVKGQALVLEAIYCEPVTFPETMHDGLTLCFKLSQVTKWCMFDDFFFARLLKED